MTADELARSYFGRARKRRKALEVLLQEDAFADVVREAQELVELVLKGMLRAIGIDPPKWHDVGGLLVENADRFSDSVRDRLDDLAATSAALRKERELAFYGDVDFIPDERYDRAAAEAYVERVDRVLDALTRFEAVL
jgi:HEPN domain-containing protein